MTQVTGFPMEPKTERAEELATGKGMIVTQRPKEKPQVQQISSWQTKLCNVDWQRFIADPTDVGEWMPGAIERLKNGDVSSTQFGIRVRVREDLGEYGWEGAAAFWPKQNRYGGWFCSCEEFSASDMCSHVLAARMYRRWLKESATDGAAGTSSGMWKLPCVDDDTIGSGASVDEDEVHR